jgi:ribosomal protein S18 acetylase RimI-like enzyme
LVITKTLKVCPASLVVVKISVRRFEQGDVPFGKTLTDGEGWQRTTKDWERLLRIEPSGMFKATSDGKDAGVAAVTSYGTLAWIHSVIVAKEYRGQGVGVTLMDACIDYCESHGARCMKLDAVPGAKSFYEKLGFVTEFESLRFVRPGAQGSALVQRMRPEDLRSVLPFDRAMTKLNRAKVLEEIFRDNPEWAFFARDSHGIRGYLLGWQGENRVNLGPCVCVAGSDQWFVKLVRSAMCTDPAKNFRICVSARNNRALLALKSMDFEKVQSSTRMFMGDKFAETEASYAMISPEKG